MEEGGEGQMRPEDDEEGGRRPKKDGRDWRKAVGAGESGRRPKKDGLGRMRSEDG